MTSPLGIVLAGVGAAIGLVTGLGIPGAIGLAAVAWGGRVAAAIPRGDKRRNRIDPFVLSDPWRRYVQASLAAQDRFERTVEGTPEGPLRERLTAIGGRLEQGVDEVWQVASRGDDIDGGLATLDVRQAQAELARLDQEPAGSHTAATREALRAQLATAARMQVGLDGGPRPPPPAGRSPGRAGGAGRRALGQRERVGHLRPRRRRRQPGQRDGVAAPGAGGGGQGRRGRHLRPTPGVAQPVTAPARSGEQRLLAANVSVALGTLFSRLTGLLRVIVFGIVIGQNALADAYDGANNSPNSIYELLLGGVLSATLVPLFTKHLEDDDEEATDAVVTVAAVVLAAVTAAAVIAAPLIFRLFSLTPSPDVDADQYRSVGTALARIFLIQIFFYGLMALGSALLQARRRFFAPAWAPVLSQPRHHRLPAARADGAGRAGPVARPGQRRRPTSASSSASGPPSASR